MPYLVITDDNGNTLYSKELSEEFLGECTRFLRSKLPIINQAKRYREMIKNAANLFAQAGLIKPARKATVLRFNGGNQNRTNRTRTR